MYRRRGGEEHCLFHSPVGEVVVERGVEVDHLGGACDAAMEDECGLKGLKVVARLVKNK